MDGDHVVELFLGHFAHGGVAGDACVVHHDVDGAESRRCGAEQGCHIRLRRDVASDTDGINIQCCRSLFGFALIKVADDDSSTIFGESTGDRQADALCASGDDGGVGDDGPLGGVDAAFGDIAPMAFQGQLELAAISSGQRPLP